MKYPIEQTKNNLETLCWVSHQFDLTHVPFLLEILQSQKQNVHEYSAIIVLTPKLQKQTVGWTQTSMEAILMG